MTHIQVISHQTNKTLTVPGIRFQPLPYLPLPIPAGMMERAVGTSCLLYTSSPSSTNPSHLPALIPFKSPKSPLSQVTWDPHPLMQRALLCPPLPRAQPPLLFPLDGSATESSPLSSSVDSRTALSLPASFEVRWSHVTCFGSFYVRQRPREAVCLSHAPSLPGQSGKLVSRWRVHQPGARPTVMS